MCIYGRTDLPSMGVKYMEVTGSTKSLVVDYSDCNIGKQALYCCRCTD